jgi:UDP-glucose 4-epimerase
VGGTFNVFEAAVASGVKKIVYASSASIYGPADFFPTSERHHPYNNRSFHGFAKLINEGIARTFHDSHGLPSVGLRYFDVYGPRMEETGADADVVARWMSCAEQNVSPQVPGDGSATMDLVYVGDVARVNVLAIKSDRQEDVYNVASGIGTSLLELWQGIREVTRAYHLEPEFQQPLKADSAPRRMANIRRARTDLGFRPETTLKDGLRQMAAWRRKRQSVRIAV